MIITGGQNIAVSVFVVIFLSLLRIDANTSNCLDSCSCDVEEEVINCSSGGRDRLFVPKTLIRGFTVIRANNNTIKELPSEDILLEMFPDLKVVSVKRNTEFNCSSLEEFKRIKVLNDCGKSLVTAVKNGNLTEASRLIGEGVDVNSIYADGNSALHWAVRIGNEKMIKLLAEHGADLEARDKLGYHPLQLAAEMGYDQIVRLLLHKGVNIKSTIFAYNTALHVAVNFYSLNVVQTMLSQPLEKYGEGGKSAFVNAKDAWGWTALHYAYKLKRGDTQFHNLKRMAIVEFLVENGADQHIRNNNGNKPYHLQD